MGRRLEGNPGFGIDWVAGAAAADPILRRLDNLPTDVLPHLGGSRKRNRLAA